MNKILDNFLDFKFEESKMPIITITKYPSDFPDKFVARLFYVSSGSVEHTKYIVLNDNIESLRESIPPNLNKMIRDKNDDVVIVESYL